MKESAEKSNKIDCLEKKKQTLKSLKSVHVELHSEHCKMCDTTFIYLNSCSLSNFVPQKNSVIIVHFCFLCNIITYILIFFCRLRKTKIYCLCIFDFFFYFHQIKTLKSALGREWKTFENSLNFHWRQSGRISSSLCAILLLRYLFCGSEKLKFLYPFDDFCWLLTKWKLYIWCLFVVWTSDWSLSSGSVQSLHK